MNSLSCQGTIFGKADINMLGKFMWTSTVPHWPACLISRISLTTEPFLFLGLQLLWWKNIAETRYSQTSSRCPFVSNSIWHPFLDAITRLTLFFLPAQVKKKILIQTKPWIIQVAIYQSSFTRNINQCHDVQFQDTHTHTQAHTISNVRYQIQHHCVLTNTLLLCQVVSSFFHWNLKDRKWNRWCHNFPAYSLHCKMMHRLYLWADISSLS